jgi:AcrR family transcriptional regulator
MDPEDRKKHLLACARRVFARNGYHTASIDDIIKEAGVARGTFYNYFESKRAVFQQVLEVLFEEVWASVPPIRVGEGEDVPAQIVGNLTSLCALLERDRDIGRIVLAGAGGLDPESDKALARFYESCRDRLTKALRTGQALGIVGEGDAMALAISIMGILKEYWSHSLLGIGPPPIESFLLEVYRFFQTGFLKEARAPKKRR